MIWEERTLGTYQVAYKSFPTQELIEEIYSAHNIQLALVAVKLKRLSKAPPTERRILERLEGKTPESLAHLFKQRIIQYQPHLLKSFQVIKAKGKIRQVVNLSVYDRIIQQSIKQVIEPICERRFNPRSHAYRPGRSTKTAISSCIRCINQEKTFYVVNLDIKNFFDTINHTKLIEQLWQIGIQDTQILRLIEVFLNSVIELPNGRLKKLRRGVAQGGIISPLLANVNLNELDWFLTHQTEYPLNFVRYADDLKIFTNNEKNAEKIFLMVKEWLKINLKLEINEEKSGITNLKRKGVHFLGFMIRVEQMNGKYQAQVNMSFENEQKVISNIIQGYRGRGCRSDRQNLKLKKTYTMKELHYYYGRYINPLFRQNIKLLQEILAS